MGQLQLLCSLTIYELTGNGRADRKNILLTMFTLLFLTRDVFKLLPEQLFELLEIFEAYLNTGYFRCQKLEFRNNRLIEFPPIAPDTYGNHRQQKILLDQGPFFLQIQTPGPGQKSKYFYLDQPEYHCL